MTRLLTELGRGGHAAADQLAPLLYDELRRIAHRQLSRERPDHTLNTTALVHEASEKLVGLDVLFTGSANSGRRFERDVVPLGHLVHGRMLPWQVVRNERGILVGAGQLLDRLARGQRKAVRVRCEAVDLGQHVRLRQIQGVLEDAGDGQQIAVPIEAVLERRTVAAEAAVSLDVSEL